MSVKSKPVVKYLERHAEDSGALGAEIEGMFDNTVVIPAYGEGETLDAAIETIPTAGLATTLAVVTLNARKRSPPEVKAANAAARQRLRNRYPQCQILADDTSVHATPFGRLVLLERLLPSSQGVGLARKFGVDFALGAWAAEKVRSNWIYCTDADVRLPPDYFVPPPQVPAGTAAMLLNFRHFPDLPALERSAKIYDAWLRAYVLGLKRAGSPYAFHTIGSTLAIDATAYAAVRGFPKRNAAEDFYVLNKLSKQGPIIRSPAAPIELAARLSDRVPFGTGRAMHEAYDGGEDALPFFYDPTLFDYLRVVLLAAEQALSAGANFSDAIRAGAQSSGLAAGPLIVACDRLEIDTAMETAIESAPGIDRRRRAFHGWFDAFRTMKFIHTMRDNGIESDPWSVAVVGLTQLLDSDDEWTADDRAVLEGTIKALAQ